MSPLFALARDYIDRMSNPRFGVAINEAYSIEFGWLLADEEFAYRLRDEVARLDDPRTLTSHGWLWLIDWAHSTDSKLNPELLGALLEEWTSPMMRAQIIYFATRKRETLGPSPGDDLMEFPDPLLRRFLAFAVSEGGDRKMEDMERRYPGAHAEAILIALMQAGTPGSIEAAAALLRHKWGGQHRLQEWFYGFLEGLDGETRELWAKRMGLGTSPR